jgi:quercetin dioxygenase-like cupin family protein
MKTTSLTNAPKVPIDLEGYIMHVSPSLEVIHLCLQPGESVSQHPNPFDVVACLVEGEVNLDMGENHTRLQLYDVSEIEKNVPRGFTNTGKTKARLLILKIK